MRIDQPLNLRRDIVTLLPQRCQLCSEAWDHERRRVGASDDHGLLVERGGDLVGPVSALAGRKFQHPRRDSLLARCAQLRR